MRRSGVGQRLRPTPWCGTTYRPHIVVAKRSEERLRRDALSVIHVTLVRVVSEDTVHNNADFTIAEPAFGTEPCLGGHSG